VPDPGSLQEEEITQICLRHGSKNLKKVKSGHLQPSACPRQDNLVFLDHALKLGRSKRWARDSKRQKLDFLNHAPSLGRSRISIKVKFDKLGHQKEQKSSMLRS